LFKHSSAANQAECQAGRKNGVRAYVWFSVAVAQGLEEARLRRDTMADMLTPDQLARGQGHGYKVF